MPVGQNAKKAEANFFCELPIQMVMVGIVAAYVLAPSAATAREYFVSPVGAKRFGKPIFVDQEFPEPMLYKPRL